MNSTRHLCLVALLGLLCACGSDAADPGDARDAGSDGEGSDASAFCDSATICGGACVDTATDNAHCGDCDVACAPTGEHDEAACVDSSCVRSCEDRWFDHDGDGTCETFCVPTNQGIEACDGVDNDCDGSVDTDDDSFANLVCAEQRGVCEGTVATCVDGTSTCDYRTHAGERRYQPTETRCDGRDNDCDGLSDETCCMPATTPQIDDTTMPLDVAGLEVLVAGVAHADAQSHILLRAQYLDAELELQTIWRAESGTAAVHYHPLELQSHLLASPALADGIFRGDSWQLWYLEQGSMHSARLLPDAAEAVTGTPLELDALPSPIFALRAFALDEQLAALYVSNNEFGRIYVLDESSAVVDAYSIERAESSVLGVFSGGGSLFVLEAIELDDEIRLRIFDLASSESEPVESLDGVPLMVPFVEHGSGGLVGAIHVDGVSQAIRITPDATFEPGASVAADPWQCIAAWVSDEGQPQLARYVESDGSGALELLGVDGGLPSGWVGERLCPLTASATDDLTSIAVGLIGDRLPRRVALLSVSPDGEYYCAQPE